MRARAIISYNLTQVFLATPPSKHSLVGYVTTQTTLIPAEPGNFPMTNETIDLEYGAMRSRSSLSLPIDAADTAAGWALCKLKMASVVN